MKVTFVDVIGIAYSIDVKLMDDNYNAVETMETRTLANGGV